MPALNKRVAFGTAKALNAMKQPKGQKMPSKAVSVQGLIKQMRGKM